MVCQERPPTKSLPGAESLEGVERPLEPPCERTSCWWWASRLGCRPVSWSFATLKQKENTISKTGKLISSNYFNLDLSLETGNCRSIF